MNLVFILLAIAFTWLLALELRHHSFAADNKAQLNAIKARLGIK